MTDIDDTQVSSGSTIGLTQQGRDALDVLEAKKWFANGVAAFRVAVTYAIANGVEPTTSGSFGTVWSVASIDREGDFKPVVELLAGSSLTWDAIQRLGDAGLKAMARESSAATLVKDVILNVNTETS